MALPQLAQAAGNIGRLLVGRKPPPVATAPPPPPSVRRARRQFGQRRGSFVKPLDWWNSCSPVVKVKSAPQSPQASVLSVYGTRRPPNSLILSLRGPARACDASNSDGLWPTATQPPDYQRGPRLRKARTGPSSITDGSAMPGGGANPGTRDAAAAVDACNRPASQAIPGRPAQ